MKRFCAPVARRMAAPATACLAQSRTYLFPCSPAPLPMTFGDQDQLELAVKTISREMKFDDMNYMRELAFCRIHDNPTVGEFRSMSPAQRRDLWHGSTRPEFFAELTYRLCGAPELLYYHDCGVEF